MLGQVVFAFAAILVGYGYKAIKPPPPKICGSPGGPLVTSPRIKLKDGRNLAYKEAGVCKEDAKFKIIVIHGYGSSKDLRLPVSQELVEEFKIYFLFYDRAGYGESDPYPGRSVKSEAYDVEELANALQLGTKFYVIGISTGAYPAWSCIKYIPQRLAGVSLVVPMVNYWWPWVPGNLSKVSLNKLPVCDQWTFRVAHYAPWLLYWWLTQKWFPALSITSGNTSIFTRRDMEIIKMLEGDSVGQEKICQQGDFECLHRDLIVSYGKWEFDIIDLRNPFPEDEGSVHLWQAYDDKIIPYQMSRFISQKLQWIKYHEVPDSGHWMMFDKILCESIIRALLCG